MAAELTMEAVEPIAIIGASGRYPAARNLQQFWHNLHDGRNCIVEVPAWRWDIRHYHSPGREEGRTSCKWIGLLENADCFDAPFFNISSAEASLIDPQHRIFLQESYRVFERAGYNPRSFSNTRCGVYLGMLHCEYNLIMQQELGWAFSDTLNLNGFALAAARIAYHLNLKGPAVAIDTACSSSLVAVHLACQALRAGEVDAAVAGGVTLYLYPGTFVALSKIGMLSSDGCCRPFDDRANGFVPGEGVGTVLLKRLRDAKAAGDPILAMIMGSAVNQNGKTNGITAPSTGSQVAVERAVYDGLSIDPATVTYVEMHATGTKLGDAIELSALATVFRDASSTTGFCAIGSVKGNIGHASGAAGVAGLHKVLGCLQHKMLVPTLHYKEANRYFDIDNSPFYVPVRAMPWDPCDCTLRRAAISSFGMSGTNAHLVVQEWRPNAARSRGARGGKGERVAIVLSAKSVEQLFEQARTLLDALRTGRYSDPDLLDIAYTLQTGREPMECRLVILCSVIEDLVGGLNSLLEARDSAHESHVLNSQAACVEELRAAAGERSRGTDPGVLAGTQAALAQLWVQGVAVDWATLYRTCEPHRLDLPAYPFLERRYWVHAPRPSGESN